MIYINSTVLLACAFRQCALVLGFGSIFDAKVHLIITLDAV